MGGIFCLPGVHPPPHQPSPAGSASATPPQGGSDLKACIRRSSITPPLRGSRREGEARSRAGGGQTPRPVEPEGGKRRVRRRAGGGQTRRSVSDYQRPQPRRRWIVGAVPERTASPKRRHSFRHAANQKAIPADGSSRTCSKAVRVWSTSASEWAVETYQVPRPVVRTPLKTRLVARRW